MISLWSLAVNIIGEDKEDPSGKFSVSPSLFERGALIQQELRSNSQTSGCPNGCRLDSHLILCKVGHACSL